MRSAASAPAPSTKGWGRARTLASSAPPSTPAHKYAVGGDSRGERSSSVTEAQAVRQHKYASGGRVPHAVLTKRLNSSVAPLKGKDGVWREAVWRSSTPDCNARSTAQPIEWGEARRAASPNRAMKRGYHPRERDDILCLAAGYLLCVATSGLWRRAGGGISGEAPANMDHTRMSNPDHIGWMCNRKNHNQGILVLEGSE